MSFFVCGLGYPEARQEFLPCVRAGDGTPPPILSTDNPVVVPWHLPLQPPLPSGTNFVGFRNKTIDSSGMYQSMLDLNSLLLGHEAVGTGNIYNKKFTDYPSLRTKLDKASIPSLIISGYSYFYAPYLTRTCAWEIDGTGATGACNGSGNAAGGGACGHSYAIADAAFKKTVTDRLDKMIQAGISTYVNVDFSLPQANQKTGAYFGFSESFLSAIQNDLLGQDDGFQIIIDGKKVLWHFRDYVNHYTGTTFSPADFSLNDWTAYLPPKNHKSAVKTPRRLLLSQLLRSYEWFKLADWSGRYYAEKGGAMMFMPNPESTGSWDFDLLAKTAGSNTVIPEVFGNTPLAAEAAYSSYGFLRRSATQAGHRLGITLETGPGGNVYPYTDYRVAYTSTYELTAAAATPTQLLDFLENDFIDHIPLSQAFTQNPFYYFTGQGVKNACLNERPRFQDSLAKSTAFLEARREKAMKPQSSILCVNSRGPASGPQTRLNAIPYSFSPALSGLHMNFDTTDDTELEKILNNYQVVAYSNLSPKVGVFKVLRRFLLAQSNRTLFLHSFIPSRDAHDFLGYSYVGQNGTSMDNQLGKSQPLAALGMGAISMNPNNTTDGSPNYATITRVAPGWGGLPVGNTYEFDEPLTLISGAVPLIMSDLGPLVSLIKVGQSQIIYFHFSASDMTQGDVFQATALAMKNSLNHSQIAPLVTMDPLNLDVSVQSFSVPGGHSIIVWDRAFLQAFSFAYNANLNTALGSDSTQYIDYLDPGFQTTVFVSANAGQKHALVYDVWNDSEKVVPAVNGMVELSVSNSSTAFFYVGQDTAVLRNTIAQAKASKNRLPFSSAGAACSSP